VNSDNISKHVEGYHRITPLRKLHTFHPEQNKQHCDLRIPAHRKYFFRLVMNSIETRASFKCCEWKACLHLETGRFTKRGHAWKHLC